VAKQLISGSTLGALSAGARRLVPVQVRVAAAVPICAVTLFAASGAPTGAAVADRVAGPTPATTSPASATIDPSGSGRPFDEVIDPIATSAAGRPAARPASTPTRSKSAPPATTSPVISALAADGIPQVALEAYKHAAAELATSEPSCGIDWSLLAGIGRVESNHGRFAGAVLHADGTSTPPIIGIALDGSRSAVILDTDHGRLDGDMVYDRAVGPMQFIPGTWARWGADGNGDGRKDPFNINDAALAAGSYLCSAGGDLRTVAGQSAAVLAYNHSDAYVAEVLGLAHSYATGTTVVVTPLLPPASTPTLPPVNPAPPPAATPTPKAAAKSPSKSVSPSRSSSPAAGSTSSSPSSSSSSSSSSAPSGGCSSASSSASTSPSASVTPPVPSPSQTPSGAPSSTDTSTSTTGTSTTASPTATLSC
jgi:membrane-bound lytic murein transglycosylase B